ncbi:hypothetical protein [Microterricola viridarii]|uniref:SipW-cognate class signal peptide n=1 Tax=Microterricola viridarii TaxID=412690 RepID=A0A1H1Z1X2_9MICO|nr:hypothetical protein [Microterricola viridarii]SDT27785.1 hypothetical protein SAMN04489834_3288 [Microterricola viridarii]
MTASTSSKRTKRSTAIRLSLAGLALVGIGAAATTAAWTDNVFFSASASTMTFNLQGKYAGGTFVEGDTSGTAIAIPSTAFANLTPGDTKTAVITVKNAGTLTAYLSPASLSATGDLFAGGTPATASITSITAATPLAPGAELDLTVTVTAPSVWANSYQGKSGAITVQVTGASS